MSRSINTAHTHLFDGNRRFVTNRQGEKTRLVSCTVCPEEFQVVRYRKKEHSPIISAYVPMGRRERVKKDNGHFVRGFQITGQGMRMVEVLVPVEQLVLQ